MKELNNRVLGSCDLYISWHSHLVRHAAQRTMLGLAQHPPTCASECSLVGTPDQRAQCEGKTFKTFPESSFMWYFKVSMSYTTRDRAITQITTEKVNTYKDVKRREKYSQTFNLAQSINGTEMVSNLI